MRAEIKLVKAEKYYNSNLGCYLINAIYQLNIYSENNDWYEYKLLVVVKDDNKNLVNWNIDIGSVNVVFFEKVLEDLLFFDRNKDKILKKAVDLLKYKRIKTI